MAPLPLSRLEFVATSVAEELGFIALVDLAAASPGEDARVIGGHMVSLHALRWQLELPRETLDADLGVTPEIVQTPDVSDRLLRLGYERLGGNRFARRIKGLRPSKERHRRRSSMSWFPATRAALATTEPSGTTSPRLKSPGWQEPCSVRPSMSQSPFGAETGYRFRLQ